MRTIVVGMGVQGEKRKRFAGRDFVASVDPVRAADYRSLEEVPLDSYDAAMLCVPDEPKIALLNHLAAHGKHALVEKPLWAIGDDALADLEARARAAGSVFYTAYNHRFEPHYMRMRALLEGGELGRVYRCRMFYGNGTARLVRDSTWRDKGAGVWPDLGSHLMDTLVFWFGPGVLRGLHLASAHCFENRAPDHVVVAAEAGPVKVELEMTLLMWRNHFTCDVLAEGGTAHIRSLCKWGPTTFTRRTRILPSGRPPEQSETLVQDDPTWALEYAHFAALVAAGRPTDLSTDRLLNETMQRISADAIAAVQSGDGGLATVSA